MTAALQFTVPIRGRPRTHIAPNEVSFMSLLDRNVKLASRGPPMVANPKITLQGTARSDVSLMMKTLETRAKAVAGAGGKPPFNGNKGPLMMADLPQPGGGGWGAGRPLSKPELGYWDKAMDRVYGAFGRKNHRIQIVEGHHDILLTRPRWSEAEVRSLDEGTALLFGAPEHGGFANLIEIRVPIVQQRPSTFIMRLKTWYKGALNTAQKGETITDIGKLLKSSDKFDAAETALRIKALVKDTYNADEIWLNIELEGGKSVTVVEAVPKPKVELEWLNSIPRRLILAALL